MFNLSFFYSIKENHKDIIPPVLQQCCTYIRDNGQYFIYSQLPILHAVLDVYFTA